MWEHAINPVALNLGFIQIHWYGLMYVVGFGAAWWLGNRRASQPNSGWTDQQVADLIFWGAIGVVLGGRAGYVLFYNFSYFLQDPLWLFAVWEGGMSFHGGLLGVVITLLVFSRRYQKNLFDIGDFVAPLIPIGLGAGRLGNFIGGELWGRPTDQSWGVIFPYANDGLARHPSQLYQMALEGVVLFTLLWCFHLSLDREWQFLGYSCCFMAAFVRWWSSFANLIHNWALSPLTGSLWGKYFLCR